MIFFIYVCLIEYSNIINFQFRSIVILSVPGSPDDSL